MFHLLPLLKGWEYKFHKLERSNVIRGANPIELRVSEAGWLVNIGLVSTDSYGTLKVLWQGADLETTEWEFNAESTLALGAVAQDPSGWVQRYFRPNPNSTAGIFATVPFSGGTQGAVWPYVPTVIMQISLPADSTQDSAYISALAITIAITDPKAFLLSLRKALGIKGKIDPALFTVGPAQMKEET
jgi:hypothetical protein